MSTKIADRMAPHGVLSRDGSMTMQASGGWLHACLGICLVLVAPGALAQTTTTSYTYDVGGHVASVTDPRGLVTSYTYDGLGQKWQQVSPDSGTTSYSYDAYGRLATLTRADGGQTSYGYDAISRRTSVSAGGVTQTFAYDGCTNGVGRLCSVADPTGSVSYTYNPEGLITGRGFSIQGTNYAYGYGYNSLDQLQTVAYPDGNQAIYSYSNGVVSAVQINVGGTVSNAATTINYRPGNGPMAGWTSANGLTNTLTYDADGRLTSIAVPGVQGLGLTYDAANRVVGISNSMDATMTQSFGYDSMSRLASVYSQADNEAFTYDANGNRASQVLNSASATVTPSSNSNQILSLAGSVNTSYGYDAKGNVTTVSGTPTFSYDAFNRLSAAPNASYYVDGEGQRLRKTVSGTSTYFAPSEAGALLAENPGAWTDYVWLNGRLIGRITGGQFQSIHDDQVGRPEAITDGGGMLVWRAKNFAFDRTVTVTNTVPLNLGFPGQYYDAESGLWNNGFRDYSPALGRYVESDPLGQAAGVNTYAYVGGNPLSQIDPYGLQEEETEESRFEEMEAMFPKIGPNQVRPLSIVEEQLRDGTCRAPTGRSGNPLRNPNYQPGVNDPANINGIDYSGHALDQMQNRGFVPSIIENTINNGEQFDTRPGTTGYYDPVNNVRVIVNSNTGNVITVIPGVPSRGGK